MNMEQIGSLLKFLRARGFEPDWDWQRPHGKRKPNSYTFFIRPEDRKITDDEGTETTEARKLIVRLNLYLSKRNFDKRVPSLFNKIREFVKNTNHSASIHKGGPLEQRDIELRVDAGFPKDSHLRVALDQLDATEVHELHKTEARIAAARRVHNLLLEI